jgi:post-segregation antitoxin (ccd killing protein)
MAKTSIIISDDLFEQAKGFSNNFSAFVTEAIREYIRTLKIKKALDSFGTWEERGQDSASIVNTLRSDEGRAFADHSD